MTLPPDPAMADRELTALLEREQARLKKYGHMTLPAIMNLLDEREAEIKRLRPPCTPESLHDYSSLACIAFFKTEADCDAFMKWLSERDDEARGAGQKE